MLLKSKPMPTAANAVCWCAAFNDVFAASVVQCRLDAGADVNAAANFYLLIKLTAYQSSHPSGIYAGRRQPCANGLLFF
jgi:hypothetical protein